MSNNVLTKSSLITHASNIAVRILRARIDKKIENILGEDQFGFGKVKELRIQLIKFRVGV